MAESYAKQMFSYAGLMGRANVPIHETARPAPRPAADEAGWIESYLPPDGRDAYDPDDERAALRGIAVGVAFSLPLWGAVGAALAWLL